MLHPSLPFAAAALLFVGCAASHPPYGNRLDKTHPAGNSKPILVEDLRALTSAKPLQAKTLRVAFSGLRSHDKAATPETVARVGQRTMVEVIREFRYPTAFDFPVAKPGSEVVTPTTPTEFETQNTGLTIEFTPELRGPFVVLRGIVQERRFEGFIQNAGDVFRPIGARDGKLITPNRVSAPMFTTRETPFYAVLQPGKAESFKVNTERGIRPITVVCTVDQ